MSFCAYVRNYMVLHDNIHVASWKYSFIHCTDSRAEDNLLKIYMYM